MARLKYIIDGDDSPIRKKLEKLKKDEANLSKARSKATTTAIDAENQQLKKRLQITNQQTEAIKKRNAEEAKAPVRRPIISDSKAEVAAYARSKSGSGSGPIVPSISQQSLINQFKELEVQQSRVAERFNAGRISAEGYNRSVDAMSKKQAEIRSALQQFGSAQNTSSGATDIATKKLTAQSGILERLTGQLKTYKEQKIGQTSVEGIALANKKIEETTAEIARLNNIGRAGFDEMGNKIEGTVGRIERLKRVSAEYSIMAAKATDPRAIAVYNSRMQQTGDAAQRLSNVGKAGFDQMGNAIKGSTNLLGQFWNGLKLAANILPGIGIAGLLAFAVGPIIEYIAKLDIFGAKVSEIAEKLKTYNEVNLNANKIAGTQISTLKVLYAAATDVTISTEKRTAAAKELQKVFPAAFANSRTQAILNGQEAESYRKLTQDILANARAKAAKDKLDEIEAKRLDISFQREKVRAANQAENARAEARRGATVDVTKLKGYTGDMSPVTIKGSAVDRVVVENNIRAKEADKELEIQEERLKNQSEFLVKYVGNERLAQAVIQPSGKTKGIGAGENTLLKARQDVLNKIDDLEAEYSRKSLSREDEAKQALIDKFDQIYRDIREKNEDIRKYNEKNGAKVGYISTGKVDDVKRAAVSTLEADLEVDKAKVSIAQQKQLFEQYEDFKLEYGKAKADERFGTELKGYESYVSLLEGQLKQLEGLSDPKSNALKDFYTKELPSAQQAASDKRFEADIKNLQRVLDASKTAASEEKRINEQYDKDLAALRKEFAGQELEEREMALAQVRQRELEGLKQMAFEASEVGRTMAVNLFYLTRKEIEKQIEKIQSLLKSADLTPEQRKGLEGLLDNTRTALAETKGFAKVAEDIASAANQIAGALTQLGDAIGGDTGYTISQLGSLVGIAGNAAGAAASFATGDYIGAATKAISVVTGLFSMGKKVKEMNAAARAEVKKYYDDAAAGEMNYQSLLRKREQDTAARGKNSYRAIIDQLEAIKKQAPEVEAAYNKIFASLQGGEFKDGEGFKHGTWLRKAKTWDIMAALAGSDYDQLEKLDLQGKLIGDEKVNFDQLKQLREELDAAGVSVVDLQESLRQLLTGTSTSGLADGLTQLFENGKRSAQDFGASFEEIMRTSIMNTFKAKYLEDALQPFYEELAKLMEGGNPTDAQIEALKQKYIDIAEQADNYLDNVEKVTGRPVSSNESPSALASNTIKASLTEDTASRALGIWTGMYDINKQTNANILKQLEVMNTGHNLLIEQRDIGMQSVRHQQETAANTAATVVELRSAVNELKAINKNTGNRGRDIGV